MGARGDDTAAAVDVGVPSWTFGSEVWDVGPERTGTLGERDASRRFCSS
jgi:hypothetical protein